MKHKSDAKKHQKYLDDPEVTGGNQDLIQRYEFLVREAESKAAYWQAEIDASGGVKYSHKTIQKGDLVYYWAGWQTVILVNKKSVTTGIKLSSSQVRRGEYRDKKVVDIWAKYTLKKS